MHASRRYAAGAENENQAGSRTPHQMCRATPSPGNSEFQSSIGDVILSRSKAISAERPAVKQLVGREAMEAAAEAFSVASREDKVELERRCGRLQEDLTAFAVVYSMGLANRALVLGAFAVIFDAFLRSGARFRKIRPGEITHAWKASAAFVRDLGPPGAADATSEPEVVRFILDLLEARAAATIDPESPEWVAVRILKVAADCLNRAGILPPARR